MQQNRDGRFNSDVLNRFNSDIIGKGRFNSDSLEYDRVNSDLNEFRRFNSDIIEREKTKLRLLTTHTPPTHSRIQQEHRILDKKVKTSAKNVSSSTISHMKQN